MLASNRVRETSMLEDAVDITQGQNTLLRWKDVQARAVGVPSVLSGREMTTMYTGFSVFTSERR